MENGRISTICNGEIEIFLLKEFDFAEGLKMLRESFFVNENVCKATDLALPESIKEKDELEAFAMGMLKEGVSLGARHLLTNQIVGVALNTLLHVPKEGEETYFEKFQKTQCNTESMKVIMDFLLSVDKFVNVFEEYQIDCYFEIMFLSIASNFGQRKIGEHLCSESIKFARNLHKGLRINLPSKNENDLQDIKKIPKAVSALFTSKYSQRIGEKLGFESLKEIPFTQFSYKGRTFAEKIGPGHPFSRVAALKF